MKNYSSALIASIPALAMLFSGPVLPADDDDEAEVVRALEEVIVTATKRDVNMQLVPLPVTAFSQEFLDRIGANDIERLDALTPGLEWGQHGAGAKISIRGMSVANSEANSDSPVGFFVDGIYLGRGQQFWAVTNDVERVEVLRGPQGTLFGRNTSAGAINIISRKPSREQEFKIELTVGDYSHVGTSGYFNMPLGDNWAGRLTFYTEDHDGYLKNTFDSRFDQMDEDIWSVRAALRYDNGPWLVDFAVDTWEQGGIGNGFSGAKFFSLTDSTSNTWASILAGAPIAANSPNDWEIEANRSYRDRESTNTTMTISYDFANTTFKSITGYSDYSGTDGGETDFTGLFLFDCRLETDSTIFSQEFQLSSNNPASSEAGGLEWTVGLYYLDEDQDELFAITGADVPIGTADFFQRFGTAKAESMAAYGQATYNVNENVGLTFGARYTSDDKSYTNIDGGGREIPPTSETFDDTTWIVGVDYKLDDSRMIYALISTGYKAGGFNRYTPLPPPNPQYDVIFRPETLTNYEIGFKGDLADNTLRANLAAYINKIDDFQSYAFDNTIPTSVTSNAADATTKGVELELTWLPSDPVQIIVVAAYMDAYYDSYTGFTDGNLTIDASGNQRPNSPKWKWTLAASYDFDLGSAGTLTPYLQTTYKDDYFVTPGNESMFGGIDRQDSYTQTDIRLIWRSLDRHYRGELYVTNLEDNFAKTGGYLATSGYWLTYGPEPTLYGAKLAYTF